MKDMIFKCSAEGCPRTYTNKFNLKRHMEAFHSEDKKYQCKYCFKLLSSKQNLREHTFTHSGEKPYCCKEPGCGVSFRQGSQLSAHKRIHLAIKTFSSGPQENSATEGSYIKLSDFLRTNPTILEEKMAVLDQKFKNIDIKLPPISLSQEFDRLPTYILY
ncbi:unnamed protein product [Blepharisma stoltei]|uniref:C2H2-type domain-containing protein n=1 Tax=Blepharisma stoltei TaxID=1481888 RepID=A0AAU9JR70_9CILI|nr:unnamed protein product [Blepharisma stoltei]